MRTWKAWSIKEVQELRKSDGEPVGEIAISLGRTYRAVILARAKYGLSKKQARSLVTDGKKTCSKCLTEKTEADFSLDRSTQDGRHRWCKECRRAYDNARSDKVKRSEYGKKWYAKNSITVKLRRFRKLKQSA